jgi:hypothetical protein
MSLSPDELERVASRSHGVSRSAPSWEQER